VLIACTFPTDQIEPMMAAGHQFFAGLTQARIIPISAEHWPMLSELEGADRGARGDLAVGVPRAVVMRITV
jgi:hypothetical protein